MLDAVRLPERDVRDDGLSELLEAPDAARLPERDAVEVLDVSAGAARAPERAEVAPSVEREDTASDPEPPEASAGSASASSDPPSAAPSRPIASAASASEGAASDGAASDGAAVGGGTPCARSDAPDGAGSVELVNQ